MQHLILRAFLGLGLALVPACSAGQASTPAHVNPNCTFGQDQTCNDVPEVSSR